MLMKKNSMYCLMFFLYWTGKGEALSLMWKDVELIE